MRDLKEARALLQELGDLTLGAPPKVRGKMTQPNPLVGVWKIIAFQFETDDAKERRDIYDQNPSGFLIITAEGRMMALVTAGERPSDASPDTLFGRARPPIQASTDYTALTPS